MAVVLVVVSAFFIVVLSVMIRSEKKSTERRTVREYGPSIERHATRTLDGTYIIK